MLFARESDLSNRGYLQLAQEISYQWLGALATPAWWSDAHLNKALVGYLAAEIAFKVQKVTTGKIDMGYISRHTRIHTFRLRSTHVSINDYFLICTFFCCFSVHPVWNMQR